MSQVFEGLKQNIKQKVKLIIFNVEGEVSLIELQKLPPDYQKTTDEDIVVLEVSDVLGLVDGAKAELQKLLNKFPRCESCEVFLKTRLNPNRALACETARAVDACPKDKWIKEVLLGETK